jgi:hypothetical protein
MMTELDELIINLNVISIISIHQKLITRNRFLNIEPCIKPFNYFQPFKRFINGEGRDIALLRLNTIYINAFRMANNNENDNKLLNNYIKQSKNGLLSLKETYKNCPLSVSRIIVIIDKIDLFLNENINNENTNNDNINNDNINNDNINNDNINNDNINNDNINNDNINNDN